MTALSVIAIQSKKILAKSWGTLTEYALSATSARGETTQMMREVYDHGNAAATLLLDRQRREATLVRQFRLPAHLNGDDPYLIECCAGLLENDTPQDCALREAIEETGIRPSTLEHAFDIYASPGSVSEKVHCFIGFYTDADRIGDGGGLAEESEEIEMLTLPFASLISSMESGEIIDAKTIALIQHAERKGYLNVGTHSDEAP